MRNGYGDLKDLTVRLNALADEGRKIVFVFGSGLSNQVLPDVSAMVDRFKEVLPTTSAPAVAEILAHSGDITLQYQNIAALVKYQRGDAVLARVIREAVLDALINEPSGEARTLEKCRAYVSEGAWKLPAGYEAFAKYYSQLPGVARGPIVTTNFDPLIEVALRDAGVQNLPMPIEFDGDIPDSWLRENPSTPVIHIHGYWTSPATLNTIPQLNRSRPRLESSLRNIFRDSAVVVIGYAGWADSFMSVLTDKISELEFLGSELIWALYSDEPAQIGRNPLLADIENRPGVSLYLGVDGHALFVKVDAREEFIGVPHGFSLVQVSSMPGAPRDLMDFANGAQPSWRDAEPGVWPILSGAERLWDEVSSVLRGEGGSGVVVLGPMGEGKSMALRQVCTRLAAQGGRVIWREQGAPMISVEFLESLNASRDHPVVIAIDEADLVVGELAATRGEWDRVEAGVCFLLASQDRLWRRAASLAGVLRTVHLGGMSENDANLIAKKWMEYDRERLGLDEDTIAKQLLESSRRLSHSESEGTLFGAVLEVLPDGGLKGRVSELLEKLSSVDIAHTGSSISLQAVFEAICVVQHYQDPFATDGKGASRAFLARVAGGEFSLIDTYLVAALGREAAIATAGDFIYSRHPAIARSVVDDLRLRDALGVTVARVSRAGGRMRVDSRMQREWYQPAYLLWQRLPGGDSLRSNAALAAAEGAGAEWLEPRVSLLKTRRELDPENAQQYAVGLMEHREQFEDWHMCVRGFLVEYAYVSMAVGESHYALGLAVISLMDAVGSYLDRERASYGLRCVATASGRLLARTPALIGLADVVNEFMVRLLGEAGARRLMKGLKLRDDLSTFSSESLAERLRSMTQDHVAGVHQRWPMLPNRSGYNDLIRICGAHGPRVRG